MKNKGLTLIALIMIVMVLAIIAAGITVYISQNLIMSAVGLNSEKALYMAQAGLMEALVDFNNSANGLWTDIPDTNVSGELYYRVGEDANFLLVDASKPLISSATLSSIPLENINSAGAITITDLIVTWNFGGSIQQVYLGNIRVFNGSGAVSPASLNITNSTINPNTYWGSVNYQRFIFSSNIPGNADIMVTFIFSDGSSRKAYLLKGGKPANKEFSIKSTGKVVSGSTAIFRKTLVATYDTGANTITSLEESQSHLP